MGLPQGYERLWQVVSECKFGDWELVVRVDGTRSYLQVLAPEGTCNVTGLKMAWSGRKWFLSPHMTRSEVVQTALKAVLTAVEHEARERFTYRGRAIFGPHLDVDELVDLCDAGGMDVREERA